LLELGIMTLVEIELPDEECGILESVLRAAREEMT
jgi:hypothetical protein